MSTMAIREALDAAGMVAPDTSNEDLARKVLAAWSEVEAIERAAKVLDGCTVTYRPDRRYADQHDAVNLLNTIARNAP